VHSRRLNEDGQRTHFQIDAGTDVADQIQITASGEVTHSTRLVIMTLGHMKANEKTFFFKHLRGVWEFFIGCVTYGAGEASFVRLEGIPF
jgi:hypothetical protein